MTQRISYSILGLVVFFSAVFIFVFALWLNTNHSSSDLRPYLIFFHSSVSGLSLGSPVKYKGINIGIVEKINISKKDVEEIQVQVNIERTVPVRVGTVATLGFGGISGESYVELKGTPNKGPFLDKKDGETFPVIPAVESSLDRIFKTTPELLTHADDLVEKASKFFSSQNQKSLESILANIKKVTDIVAIKRESVGKILDGAGNIGGTLTSLEKAAESINKFMEKITQSIDKLDPHIQLFAESGLPDLSRVFSKLLETLQNFDNFMNVLEDKIDDLIPPNEKRTYQLK